MKPVLGFKPKVKYKSGFYFKRFISIVHLQYIIHHCIWGNGKYLEEPGISSTLINKGKKQIA